MQLVRVYIQMLRVRFLQARAAVLGGIIGIGMATTAVSMTVQASADLKTGFAANWWQPTPVSLGLSGFGREVSGFQTDVAWFPRLPPATRHVTMSIGSLTGAALSYGRGETTLCSTSPFLWSWDSKPKGVIFIGTWSARRAIAISVGVSATGVLHLTVNLADKKNAAAILLATSSTVQNAALVSATSAAGATVPLAGTLGTLATGLAALVGLGRRRRRANWHR